MEGKPSNVGVVALNGKNGSQLWQIPSRSQVYTSAQFSDLDDDGLPDVIIGGRDAQLWAIKGNTGNILWEFWPDSLGNASKSGWFNFYNPQIIQDINGDDVDDILISNGGNAAANSQNDKRYAGKLLVLSGSNGSIIWQDTMPDGRETYFAPLVFDDLVVFGSGGETKPGGLYSIKLGLMLDSGLSAATVHFYDSTKGFIAAPSFADVNPLGGFEWIIPSMNGHLYAYNVYSDSVLWDYQLDDYEFYVSPAIGHLQQSSSTDVFIVAARGVFPFYTDYKSAALNGETGEVIYERDGDLYLLQSPVIYDHDMDNRADEVLQSVNYDSGFSSVDLRHYYRVVDFDDTAKSDVKWPWLLGTNVYAMPLITRIHQTNRFDMIRLRNNNRSHWYVPSGFTIECIDLNFAGRVSWPGYLGKNTDGYYVEEQTSSINQKKLNPINAYPNPCNNYVHFSQKVDFKFFDTQGRVQLEGSGNRADLTELKSGFYFIHLTTESEAHIVVKVVKQ